MLSTPKYFSYNLSHLSGNSILIAQVRNLVSPDSFLSYTPHSSNQQALQHIPPIQWYLITFIKISSSKPGSLWQPLPGLPSTPPAPYSHFSAQLPSICVLKSQAAYHGSHSPTSSGSYLPPQPHCPSLVPTLSTDYTGLHCSNVPNKFHIKHLHIFSLYVVSSYPNSPKSWVPRCSDLSYNINPSKNLWQPYLNQPPTPSPLSSHTAPLLLALIITWPYVTHEFLYCNLSSQMEMEAL